MCKTGEPPLSKMGDCRKWHEKKVGTRSADAKRYGVPLFLSEFGSCLDTQACVEEINAVGDVSDKYLVGWAYWQFKTYGDLTSTAFDQSEGFYNKDGTLQVGKVKALSRTYMQATQGILTSMSFSTQTSEF